MAHQYAPAGPDNRDEREAPHLEPEADTRAARRVFESGGQGVRFVSGSRESPSPYVPGGWSRAFRAKLRSSAVAKRSPEEREDSLEDQGNLVEDAKGAQYEPGTTGLGTETMRTPARAKILHFKTAAPTLMVSKGEDTDKDW